MWYVYMAKCEEKLYTGMTDDVGSQFKEQKRRGSHFASYNHATKLLYKEQNVAAKRVDVSHSCFYCLSAWSANILRIAQKFRISYKEETAKLLCYFSGEVV